MALFGLLTLDTIIHVGSTFWFQLISVFGLSLFVMKFGQFFQWLDLKIAYILTGMFDFWFERPALAPMKVINDEWIEPDPSIKIDRYKVGHITRLAAIEAWLTHYRIDYSFFWDYEVNPKEAKEALSRVLAHLPIIGGVYRKIDDETIGIDHTKPKVRFIYAQTDLIPSTDDKDHGKPNWYENFNNGTNHCFPFPENKPVFRVTFIHYPHKDPIKREMGHKSTLVGIGCSHALTDGEGFFKLLRAWASEMRGEKWDVPIFDRKSLIIRDSDLKSFKGDANVLGKHFDYNTMNIAWWKQGVWPSRRWTVKTWLFNKKHIASLKQCALNGSHGDQLKQMRLSTNDVLVALFWKLRATLNRDYAFDHPTICAIVINSRKWLPNRFPSNYFGNAIGNYLIHKSRRELIDADFSEVCYFVRSAVSQLKPSQFEDDLHLYHNLLKRAPNGVDSLHRYHGRWGVGGYRWKNGRYLMDRDIMVSNLIKLPTLECNMGKGHPSRVRFNFQDDCAQMTYLFKMDEKLDEIEFYTSIPNDDIPFYEEYDIRDGNLDWTQINQKYATETKRWIRKYPWNRVPLINPKALFDGRKDTFFWTW